MSENQKPHFLWEKGKKILDTVVWMLVELWKVHNSMSDCFIWILVCSFCCSHILHFLHVLLCCLLDEGILLEYTVNQKGFTFGEMIGEGSLLDSQLTRGKFCRDNWQEGTFGETIDKGELSKRESINKGGTFRDTIGKGELSERQSFDKGDTFGETIDKGAL